MPRTIITWRDPYDEGFSTCRKKEVTFEPGVTVLVGCNGAGKSTMLHNLKEELKKEKIPLFYYDDRLESQNSVSESFFRGNYNFGATYMTASEGERISMNLGKISSQWRKFLKTGQTGDVDDNLVKAFAKAVWGDGDSQDTIPNERWILLDAMDSGFSIDNVVEMKEFFQLVLDDAKKIGVELYIVISSNEYELAHDSNCMDVMEGKYIKFKDYDDYKKFILHTREKKDKRYKE